MQITAIIRFMGAELKVNFDKYAERKIAKFTVCVGIHTD